MQKLFCCLFVLIQSGLCFPPSGTALKSPLVKPTIEWSSCSFKAPPALDCGSIDVPIDYTGKIPGNIKLGLIRLRASDPSKRIGSLLYNPGGPGQGGRKLMLSAINGNATGKRVFSNDLLSRYDVINFDPRGTGQSNPVKCDPALLNAQVSNQPNTQKGYADLVAYNKALGASCAQQTGALINFLDTMTVVKDLELVRRALDNGTKLNFFGQSYGSQIGLQYAEQYPRKINRMALDAIVDHTMSETSSLYIASGAYERVLDLFFDWCGKEKSCALHGKNAAAIFDNLIDPSQPDIPVLDCSNSGNPRCIHEMKREQIGHLAENVLSAPESLSTIIDVWDKFAVALAKAVKGDATELFLNYLELVDPLEFKNTATLNTSTSFSTLAIGCQDWSHSADSFDDLVFKQRMIGALSPHTRGSGLFYLLQAACIGWPAPTTNPQKALDQNIQSAPPILLVHSALDPKCSLVGATNIQAQLPNSVLLTRKGTGHLSYQLMGAASKAIDNFLINGNLPVQGTYVDS